MRRAALLVTSMALVCAACTGKTAPSKVSAPKLGKAGVRVSTTMREKPAVVVPYTPPPNTLTYDDIVKGSGAIAAVGSPIVVHVVGISWSTHEVFLSTWADGSPLPVVLDRAHAIAGWVHLIPGMRVGGRRLLIVPPQYAYGDAGDLDYGIGPRETLVYVVDLYSASPPFTPPVSASPSATTDQ